MEMQNSLQKIWQLTCWQNLCEIKITKLFGQVYKIVGISRLAVQRFRGEIWMAGHLTCKGRIADHDEVRGTVALIVSQTFFCYACSKGCFDPQQVVDIIVVK